MKSSITFFETKTNIEIIDDIRNKLSVINLTKTKPHNIFQLIEDSKLDEISDSIDNNITILDETDCEGRTPLMYASFLGNLDIVRIILSYAEKKYPLSNIPCYDFIKESSKPFDWNSLFYAVFSKNIDVLEYLSKKSQNDLWGKVDKYQWTIIGYLIWNNNKDILNITRESYPYIHRWFSEWTTSGPFLEYFKDFRARILRFEKISHEEKFEHTYFSQSMLFYYWSIANLDKNSEIANFILNKNETTLSKEILDTKSYLQTLFQLMFIIKNENDLTNEEVVKNLDINSNFIKFIEENEFIRTHPLINEKFWEHATTLLLNRKIISKEDAGIVKYGVNSYKYGLSFDQIDDLFS